jgi:uncharacterized protein YodC (DUF2158 family)
MTVEVPKTQLGDVACSWFDDKSKLVNGSFQPEALEIYNPPQPGSAAIRRR